MLWISAIALAAPWLFLGIITIVPATSLWDSSRAARIQASQITRHLLVASMVVLPVAASAYGAMVSRWRVRGGIFGFVVGAALWLANLLCFGYVVEHGVGATNRHDPRKGSAGSSGILNQELK
ncbi:MAG: hypothetical protein WAM82_19315 [Thermoanaerobaculia bacterium]